MIRSWIFEFFPAPHEPGAADDPQSSAAHFNWYLDLWPRAETLGFDGIFFSEHHFGPAYSPAPNLLIAQMGLRTRTIRLGVMGMVLPYHQPWRIVEEIGMLDHLTQGRLEIGTSAGIPQEMAHVGLSVPEARARNDEAIEILDAALANPVFSHHGKYWQFTDLRLVPRPLQRPHPPKWVTVISEDSARKAARRGAKICTGFHPTERVRSIFDAYRDEAARIGAPCGPDQFALRRQITIGANDTAMRAAGRAREHQVRARLLADPRLSAPGREAFDTPTSHAFTIGSDEFIAGAPETVAEHAIAQCREVGAGHFLALFDRSASREQLRDAWDMFGESVVPALRHAAV
ncbi:MAG TPA: LLM class flavin-dependent oxidoreductase [Acetobacteraceae bacterium]|jgi:alkanesulfonate monooxygenase SsuD/methylene tetrahydromethanopterin reductase-like flavin-dependent oxidoreductase (luciferase family)